jgi:hypothetical protein
VLRFYTELGADGPIVYLGDAARRWQPPHAGEPLPLTDLQEILIRVTVALARSGAVPQWVASADPSWDAEWQRHWAGVYREALRRVARG